MAEATTSAVLVAPRHIELRDFPIPTVADDDAVVRVAATGICGSDWAPYAGSWPVALPPVILGHEIVGEVVDIGEGAASRWGVGPGDRIVVEESIPCNHCRLCRTGRYHMCDPMQSKEGMRYGLTPVDRPPHLWGGFGHYVYIHPNSVVHRMSPAVPVDQAPLFIPISNGIRWVERDGGCRIGDTVVILGPGQHGLGCVIGARLAGAGIVIVAGTSQDRHRLDVARLLGADHTLDVADAPLAEQVAALTGGEMAQVVVDVTSGATGALADAVDVAGVGATVIVAGAREGKPVTGFVADKLVVREITVRGVYGHDWTSVRRAIAYIESHGTTLEPLCTHTYRLDDVDAALRTLGGEGEADAIHITVVPG
jgi:threonine dehydrogenase-like Zn-dependent dehydrogenase